MLNTLKGYGVKGIVSTPEARVGDDSRRSWEKFSKRSNRVRQVEDEEGSTFFLEGLGALPKSGRIPLSGVVEDLGLTLKAGKRDEMPVIRALRNGEEVGFVGYSACAKGQYAQIEDAFISPRVQGYGLYPALLSALRNKVKAKGCKGIISTDRTPEATASWEKFAQREPRVRRDGDTFTLEGLPKSGRIPLDTAKRVMKRLPAKTRACGITPAALREGMEIEREHRDVTKGGVLATAKIAAAHLCERKDYYKRIKRFVEN
jgi:hypothetical protein